MRRIVLSGSRSWNVDGPIYERLQPLDREIVIVVGGAKGLDQLAEEVARRLGFAVEVFPAQWRRWGRRAGIVRNVEMLDTNPEKLIAFWDGESRGTYHIIREARKRDIDVEVVEPPQ